ncbi:MAG TPA: hypothetical protein VHQ92_13370 [Pseudolabrys sp.]|nr:hypothetical protein [Pseudolabrys sp.]
MAGRKPYVPSEKDRIRVEAFVACGITQEEIRQLVINPKTGKAISLQTLNSHFRAELKLGKLNAIAHAYGHLRRAISSKVSGPQVAATIFYLKCHGGWRERPQGVEFLGKDGEPQDVAPVVLYLPDNGRSGPAES